MCEFFAEWFLRGRRIDSFLEKHLRNWSPWRIQRMVRAGCVTVNDRPVEIDYRVHPGDRVRIRLVSPPDRVPVPEPLPVEILYEDPWLLAVNKPPGQIAHPGGDFPGRTLVNALQHYLNQQTLLPGLIRPGIVHRLDRQTSGVMLIPRDHLAHRRLTEQFEQRTVRKTYLAIACGRVPDDEGEIDLPIGKVPNPDCQLMCARPNAIEARPSQTRYRVRERFAGYTFLEAQPLTGRQHQIRVHFAQLGFPLLADEFYGPFGIIKDGTPVDPDNPDEPAGRSELPDERGELDEQAMPAESPFYDPALPLRRHALHAARLEFEHPVTELPLAIDAPLPADFEATLAVLRAGAPEQTQAGTGCRPEPTQ